MSEKTAKCNDQPASERSCPDPAGSEPDDAELIEGVKALGEKYIQIKPELDYVAYRIRELQISRDLAQSNCKWLWDYAKRLTQWVEGPRHSHEEVREHNGRLKDTKVWAKFYSAVHKIGIRQKFNSQNVEDWHPSPRV